MTCTECGGKHYWWDHGPVRNFSDNPMEPYLDWNITSDIAGKEFTTRGERRKYMSQHDLEYNKKSTRPGSVVFFDQKAR